MLSEAQREMLLHGPSGWGKKQDVVKVFGGPCQIITAWRRHRAELMAATPMGKRPYAFWMVESRLKQRPAGEAGELRLIKQLDLYNSAAEREFVQKRLAVITAELRSHWHRGGGLGSSRPTASLPHLSIPSERSCLPMRTHRANSHPSPPFSLTTSRQIEQSSLSLGDDHTSL